MDSQCDAASNINVDVILVVNASWILSKIPSLSLSVPLVVRGDDNDFLSKICETNGEFINHDSETTNS